MEGHGTSSPYFSEIHHMFYVCPEDSYSKTHTTWGSPKDKNPKQTKIWK